MAANFRHSARVPLLVGLLGGVALADGRCLWQRRERILAGHLKARP